MEVEIMAIAEKIKELMEKEGTNQAKLAEVAGVSQPFMSYILNGYKVPSLPVTKRIADYFKVTIDELVE